MCSHFPFLAKTRFDFFFLCRYSHVVHVEMFKKVHEAYDVLGDEKKRREYDSRYHSPVNNVQRHSMDQNVGREQFGMHDAFSRFERMFGRRYATNSQENSYTLTYGDYVCLQGLQRQSHLNGQTGRAYKLQWLQKSSQRIITYVKWYVK